MNDNIFPCNIGDQVWAIDENTTPILFEGHVYSRIHHEFASEDKYFYEIKMAGGNFKTVHLNFVFPITDAHEVLQRISEILSRKIVTNLK